MLGSPVSWEFNSGTTTARIDVSGLDGGVAANVELLAGVTSAYVTDGGLTLVVEFANPFVLVYASGVRNFLEQRNALPNGWKDPSGLHGSY